MRHRTIGKIIVILAIAAGALGAVRALRQAGCIGAFCPEGNARIVSLTATATANDDGTFTIDERVVFHFDRPHKGLHRDLPAVVQRRGGWYRYPIVVRTVRDANNVVINHQDEASGKSLRVWIGDPRDEHVGEKAFSLAYVVNGGMMRAGARELFTWDVVGPDQRLPAERVSAVLSMPEDVADAAEISCTPSATCVAAKEGGLLRFDGTDANLRAEVSLPPSALPVIAPQKLNRLAPHVPNLPFLLPVLLFAYLSYAWLRQDPAKPLSRWRLPLAVLMVAAPLGFLRVMDTVPTFAAPGSGPNAVAALAASVWLASLFGILNWVTAPRRPSSPQP